MSNDTISNNDNTLQFYWYDVNHNITLNNPYTSLLYIPANTLQVGSYIFEFIASTTISGIKISNIAQFRFNIIKSRLIPLLTNGNQRIVTIQDGNVVTIDASQSYDPDGYTNELIFQWSCILYHHINHVMKI